MLFYILSFSSLILTTIYLYFNKIVAKKYNNNYSFQISFYSLLSIIFIGFLENTKYEFVFNYKIGLFFIFIIGLKYCIRTILIQKVLQEVDSGYFELFMKFNLIFMIIFEYIFYKTQISIYLYFSFFIFFLGVFFLFKFDLNHKLNSKNIILLFIIGLLFSIDPFLVKYIVSNGYLSLSLNYIFELFFGTLFIAILNPKNIKFSFKYFKSFFPLSIIRMFGAYLGGKAILIGSPTLVELIKGSSMLILFLIS